MKKRNIHSPGAIRPCTSCQMCYAVCPRECISIQFDREGFYRPVIDEAGCIDCGMCQSVCYKYDRNIESSPGITSYSDLYSAWSKDDNVVASTTSGGSQMYWLGDWPDKGGHA